MAPRARGQRSQQQRNDDDEPDDDHASGGGTLTQEQRTEIGEIVNAAFSSRLQRRLPSMVEAALRPQLDEIRTLLSGRQASGDDEGDPGDDEPVPIRRGTRQQPARGRRAQEQTEGDLEPAGRRARAGDDENAKLRARLDKMEAERKTEREQARSAARDNALREHLGGLGVDKNRLRGAVAVLREQAKYDDKTNEWFMEGADGADLDLEAGAAAWAATDEGKSYLAPAGAAGAASGAGGTPRQLVRGGSGTRMSAGAPRAGATAATTDPKAAKGQRVDQARQGLAQAIDSLAGGGVTLG